MHKERKAAGKMDGMPFSYAMLTTSKRNPFLRSASFTISLWAISHISRVVGNRWRRYFNAELLKYVISYFWPRRIMVDRYEGSIPWISRLMRTWFK